MSKSLKEIMREFNERIRELKLGDKLRYFCCVDGGEDLNCWYDVKKCYFVKFNWVNRLMTVRFEGGDILTTTLFHIQGF